MRANRVGALLHRMLTDRGSPMFGFSYPPQSRRPAMLIGRSPVLFLYTLVSLIVMGGNDGR